MNKWVTSRRLLVQDILCPKKKCFKPTGTPSANDDDRIFFCETRNKYGCPDKMAPPDYKQWKMIMMFHKFYYKRYIVKEKACVKKKCFKPHKLHLGYGRENPFNSICDTWFDGNCPMEKGRKK